MIHISCVIMTQRLQTKVAQYKKRFFTDDASLIYLELLCYKSCIVCQLGTGILTPIVMFSFPGCCGLGFSLNLHIKSPTGRAVWKKYS